MTDHDRQLLRVGQVNDGEAVGTAFQGPLAARRRHFRVAESVFRLSGQSFRGAWLLRRNDLVARILTQ